MRFEFRLPDVGEGISEAEIVQWHVRAGERVLEGNQMLDIMSDKATVTIDAPRSGQIEELRVPAGTMARVGDVLVVIETEPACQRVNGVAKLPAASAVGDLKESLPGASFFGARVANARVANGSSVRAVQPATSTLKQSAPPHAPPVLVPALAAADDDTQPPSSARELPMHARGLATPATRKLARELGVELGLVRGRGLRGEITADDVRRASSALQPAAGTESGALPTAEPAAVSPVASGPVKRVPFVGLRRAIAERMRAAKHQAAHYAFVEECDAGRLLDIRTRLIPEAAASGLELTLLPFVIKAVCRALRKHPLLNASLDEERSELLMHDACHIGIACATDQGLVVPVIHNAQRLSLLELAAEVRRLSAGARAGTLSRSELSGSTFTVTSLAKLGGHFAIPILNLPNVGILGVHRIKERPVVREGQLAIGKIMLLSLSLDHRVVDGQVGAAFAYDVIAALEEPWLLIAGG